MAEEPERKNVKRWIFLTLAGVLAVLVGKHVDEMVTNDPDTLLGNR